MMRYSKQEVMQYVQEEDVKFIRLSFCDVFGRQKNISIMPDELPRAFAYGIAFDGSAIAGFGDETHSDLLLHPEPDTLMLLPWRPEHGKVVRMFSSISYPDGRPFECDTRRLLKQAVADAAHRVARSISDAAMHDDLAFVHRIAYCVLCIAAYGHGRAVQISAECIAGTPSIVIDLPAIPAAMKRCPQQFMIAQASPPSRSCWLSA